MNEYLNILIVLAKVISDLALMFLQDLNDDRDVVSGLIIDDVEVIPQGTIEFVIEESVELQASWFEVFVSLVVVNELVCDLIGFRLLKFLETFLTSIETYV